MRTYAYFYACIGHGLPETKTHCGLNVMKSRFDSHLSRREAEVMDVIYRRGSATAADLIQDIPTIPSYSAVRITLRTLEQKGHLSHDRDGKRFVYSPTLSAADARESAVSHLLKTFFRGSLTEAVATMLDQPRDQLSDAELARLSDLIEQHRRENE